MYNTSHLLQDRPPSTRQAPESGNPVTSFFLLFFVGGGGGAYCLLSRKLCLSQRSTKMNAGALESFHDLSDTSMMPLFSEVKCALGFLDLTLESQNPKIPYSPLLQDSLLLQDKHPTQNTNSHTWCLFKFVSCTTQATCYKTGLLLQDRLQNPAIP